MQQGYSVVIADTSCFILLDKIDELELLHDVFGQIVTTKDIATEFRKVLPEWVSIQEVKDINYQQILLLDIDNGEASAIALAVELQNSLLIIDDNKARKIASKLNLSYTGTLGVILKAKQLNILANIRPVIEKIQQTNFRFSDKLYKEILELANE